MNFQARLEEAFQSRCLGELDFKRWRAFKNAQRSSDSVFRFVDGELIERFLDLDEKQQEKVCDGLGPTADAMRDLVEELKRLR